MLNSSIAKICMRRIFSLLLLIMLSLCLQAQEASVTSPDGRLRLTAAVNEGRATYTLSYDGPSVLTDSPIGFVASMGNFSENLQFVRADTWYIAANNATGKPLALTLSLPMLSKDETVTLYADGKDGETVVSDMKIKNPQKVKITMQHNGAMVIRTK